MIDELMNALKGRRKKRTPLLIMEKYSELLFLDKQIADMNRQHKKEHEELDKKHKERHVELWGKITNFLSDNGYIKSGTDPDLSISDGVMYIVESEDE